MRVSFKKRSIASFFGVLLMASLLPMGGAQAVGEKIEFLNPSGYATNLDISDKQDQDGTVHLVAWVGNIPAQPLVEFEILGVATIDATRVGNDTWEGDASVATLPDGPYTLIANLFSNGIQVATTSRQVTLNHQPVPPPPPANTVEMVYPQNGGSFGLSSPKDKRVNGLIDVIASDGTAQVRGLYTTTAPGTAPVWVACGSAAVTDTVTFAARIRCTLEDGAVPGQVTGVAVVANDTPAPADPNPVADATGDAHRVVPYSQLARDLDVSPDVVANAGLGTCQAFTATVTDQNTRPMAAANIDVHAVGPDDQPRFGSIAGVTSPFQKPDKTHVAVARDGIDCDDKTKPSGSQGDHNMVGQDDPQHIESTTGTNNQGQFTFALYSATVGGMRIDVFADVDDDDVQQSTETSGGSRVGWGEPPPEATRDLFLDPASGTAESGSCHRMVLLGKISGAPMAGQNVDIHINGPDETVNFCLPSDASTGTSPNAGSHTGNADDATTRHLEGTLDSQGRFIFGVTTASEGTTSIVAWADTLEDDIQGSTEATKSASVSWAISGERTISIQSNKKKVAKGRKVKISGRVDGAVACEAAQTVELKSRRLNGGRFHTIASSTTDSEGDYVFTVRVQASRRYKTAVLRSDACDAATSATITVKAT